MAPWRDKAVADMEAHMTSTISQHRVVVAAAVTRTAAVEAVVVAAVTITLVEADAIKTMTAVTMQTTSISRIRTTRIRQVMDNHMVPWGIMEIITLDNVEDTVIRTFNNNKHSSSNNNSHNSRAIMVSLMAETRMATRAKRAVINVLLAVAAVSLLIKVVLLRTLPSSTNLSDCKDLVSMDNTSSTTTTSNNISISNSQELDGRIKAGVVEAVAVQLGKAASRLSL